MGEKSDSREAKKKSFKESTIPLKKAYKIGFFGGTFDPIHFGHINLALRILEAHELDQVFFCPANFSPEKAHTPPVASPMERMEMTRLAVEEIAQFSLLSFEIEKEGPSYTIDTIRYLKEKYLNAQIHLILGEDILGNFEYWKEVQDLIQLAPPLIGARPGFKLKTIFQSQIQTILLKGMTSISTMEISGTEIRKRLLEKKYCGHLVPSKVLDYIRVHNLYCLRYV